MSRVGFTEACFCGHTQTEECEELHLKLQAITTDLEACQAAQAAHKSAENAMSQNLAQTKHACTELRAQLDDMTVRLEAALAAEARAEAERHAALLARVSAEDAVAQMGNPQPKNGGWLRWLFLSPDRMRAYTCFPLCRHRADDRSECCVGSKPPGRGRRSCVGAGANGGSRGGTAR